MTGHSVIEHIVETGRRLPVGSKLGLVVMALGIGADVVVHLTPGLGHDHGLAAGPAFSAHLIVFAGMALVLLGVVVDGVRSSLGSPDPVAQGRRSDAVR